MTNSDSASSHAGPITEDKPASVLAKLIVGVDDAAENLLLLQHLVESAGYSFIAAKSGLEGLNLLNRVVPRLILLDVEMPEMDGFETCRRMRADYTLPYTPIVFLTARNTQDDVNRCVASGGNDFITKPFEPVKLLERLNYWTTRRINFDTARQQRGSTFALAGTPP